MGSYAGQKMTYPGGGENPGDTEHSNVDPAMPGPRVKTPERGDSAGASLTEGFACREEIHSVTPEDIGADTEGGGQVHMQHPKTPAGRGTRFG
jgi:hypothetical protein